MRVVLFERDNLRWRHLAGTLPRCPTAVQHILPSSSMSKGRIGVNRGWRLNLSLAGENNPSVYRVLPQHLNSLPYGPLQTNGVDIDGSSHTLHFVVRAWRFGHLHWSVYVSDWCSSHWRDNHSALR